MKPIILKGHDRPISQILFNREGDLLFTASKGKSRNCTVWFSETGERIGTYDGHAGAITWMDVNFDSTRLLTSSADMSTRLWDVRTGEELKCWQLPSPAKAVNWAIGDKLFLTANASVMGKKSYIFIYDSEADPNDEALVTIETSGIVHVQWGPLNERIYSTHEDGIINVWNAKTGQKIESIRAHSKLISGFKFSLDKQYFATSSKDNTSKLYDSRTLECLKTFVSGRPLNDVAISPLMPHVMVVGGQDAVSVALSQQDTTQFRVRVFHTVYQQEIASIHGHFAPVNTIAFSPDGKNFASGGEDGYVRLHHLNDSYFKTLSDTVLFPAPEI